MQLNISIYNGFTFHYKVMGFIIEWCKKKKHFLTIYTKKKDNYGWLDFYKKYFEDESFNFSYKNPNEIKEKIHTYNLIFLNTDDDKSFAKFINEDRVKNILISIDHLEKSR